MDMIPNYLPESPPLFPEDMYTDRNEQFHVAEIIREKLTLQLHQEMPYGLTVQVERLVREERGIAISAIIWVERDSQKGIGIGKNADGACSSSSGDNIGGLAGSEASCAVNEINSVASSSASVSHSDADLNEVGGEGRTSE